MITFVEKNMWSASFKSFAPLFIHYGQARRDYKKSRKPEQDSRFWLYFKVIKDYKKFGVQIYLAGCSCKYLSPTDRVNEILGTIPMPEDRVETLFS